LKDIIDPLRQRLGKMLSDSAGKAKELTSLHEYLAVALQRAQKVSSSSSSSTALGSLPTITDDDMKWKKIRDAQSTRAANHESFYVAMENVHPGTEFDSFSKFFGKTLIL